MKKEYILCAAIWYKDLQTQNLLPYNCDRGIVLCGWRHVNIIAQMKATASLRSVTFGPDSVGENEQGFLTNSNKFVDREEAATIAFNANQITEELNRLHSEDIY